MPTESPLPTIFECRACQSSVIAKGVGVYTQLRDEDGEETQVGMFKCQKCAAPFLATRNGYLEHDPHEGYFTAWHGWTLLYPSIPTLPKEVPEHIRLGYREAALCFNSGSNTATAIMGRRTIEAICLERWATKSSLAKMVKELRERGVIAPQLLEWADQLRYVGNDAAHNVDEFISREDAQDVLEFVRAIVEYVYVFTHAFDRFKERRQRQAERPAATSAEPD